METIDKILFWMNYAAGFTAAFFAFSQANSYTAIVDFMTALNITGGIFSLNAFVQAWFGSAKWMATKIPPVAK